MGLGEGTELTVGLVRIRYCEAQVEVIAVRVVGTRAELPRTLAQGVGPKT